MKTSSSREATVTRNHLLRPLVIAALSLCGCGDAAKPSRQELLEAGRSECSGGFIATDTAMGSLEMATTTHLPILILFLVAALISLSFFGFLLLKTWNAEKTDKRDRAALLLWGCFLTGGLLFGAYLAYDGGTTHTVFDDPGGYFTRTEGRDATEEHRIAFDSVTHIQVRKSWTGTGERRRHIIRLYTEEEGFTVLRCHFVTTSSMEELRDWLARHYRVDTLPTRYTLHLW